MIMKNIIEVWTKKFIIYFIINFPDALEPTMLLATTNKLCYYILKKNITKCASNCSYSMFTFIDLKIKIKI